MVDCAQRWRHIPDGEGDADSAVQLEILYRASVDFVCFDVAVEVRDGERHFLAWQEARSLCQHLGIPCVPTLQEGPFHKCMSATPDELPTRVAQRSLPGGHKG